MKNFKYDVTVVIPVYNSEQFIDDCVKSLMNQTHDFNKIEVMLINDGSSDNSEAKCVVYSESFPNVTYIYKENSGVSDTRNTGIRKASGKYIMLLDSDDYLRKDTIKNLVNFFDKHYDEIEMGVDRLLV